MLELNKLYNMDCMQGMKEFPDGFFDLAIVDPPYGIGIDGHMSGAMLAECAEVCFLPDWKESKGAKYEFGEAMAQNKPFFFFADWEREGSQNAEK